MGFRQYEQGRGRGPVTLFAFSYPPREGGIARMCGEIAARLVPEIPLHVVTQGYFPRPTLVAIPPGIETTRVTWDRPRRELAAWWAMVRRPHGRPVIAGEWWPDAVITALAGHRHMSVFAHGAELTPAEQPWRRRLWRRLLRWTMERADVVIASSHYSGELVRAAAPRANVVALPLSVDHERFAPGDAMAAREKFGIRDPEARVVCTVSRIEAHKGIDVILRAIAALSEADRSRLVFLVGGLGPALPALQALATELGLDDVVKWAGFVSEEDLPKFYRAGDLYALCSVEHLDRRQVEGFGLVFLEAQACGTPVVGTRTGGIPDAIREGEGGWLIAQDDVAALAGILGNLVSEPDRFAEQGRLARARVEREATWEHYMTRLQAVLEEHLGGW